MNDILLAVVVAVLLMGLLLVIFNKHLGEWACEMLGWHLAPKYQSFDGASFEGVCPRCGSKVLLDSQGNWFSVENSSAQQ